MNYDKLNSFNDEQLTLLSNTLGLDLPSSLERIFVIQEIIDALEEDDEETRQFFNENLHSEEKKYKRLQTDSTFIDDLISADNKLLPDYFGNPKILLFPRDPSWAYTYWECPVQDYRRHGTVNEIIVELKLNEYTKTDDGKKNQVSVFDICIEESDFEWNISLPNAGSYYSVDLCIKTHSQTKTLARSNTIHAPFGNVHHTENLSADSASLLELSYVNRFIKTVDVYKNPQRIL